MPRKGSLLKPSHPHSIRIRIRLPKQNPKSQIPRSPSPKSQIPRSLSPKSHSMNLSTAAMYLLGLALIALGHAAAAGAASSPSEVGTVLLQRNSPELNYIKAACNLTLYRRVCVSSLAAYAGVVRRNQARLVRVAMEISLAKARNATVFVSRIAGTNAASQRERGALSDCLENFQDTVDQVQESLAELKSLKAETFLLQMGNVQTWMSAALTDQDTCLDGFEDSESRIKAAVAARVDIVSKYTSNALAFINNYADSGAGGLRG